MVCFCLGRVTRYGDFRTDQRSRQLSKKTKGSKNRERAKLRLGRLHYKISNIRRDCLHKVTSDLIQRNNVIVLEDLRVSNMLKNHC